MKQVESKFHLLSQRDLRFKSRLSVGKDYSGMYEPIAMSTSTFKGSVLLFQPQLQTTWKCIWSNRGRKMTKPLQLIVSRNSIRSIRVKASQQTPTKKAYRVHRIAESPKPECQIGIVNREKLRTVQKPCHISANALPENSRARYVSTCSPCATIHSTSIAGPVRC